MGQISSFDRLTLPHLDAAYNLALWLVRSESDAEDIVQESYMRAFRGFHADLWHSANHPPYELPQ